eukprot:651666-Pyramimonas_sp.AAC.1
MLHERGLEASGQRRRDSTERLQRLVRHHIIAALFVPEGLHRAPCLWSSVDQRARSRPGLRAVLCSMPLAAR